MRKIIVRNDMGDAKEYLIPKGKHIKVQENDWVKAGERSWTVRRIPTHPGYQRPQRTNKKYLVDQVQEVYRLQGVTIKTSTLRLSSGKCWQGAVWRGCDTEFVGQSGGQFGSPMRTRK